MFLLIFHKGKKGSSQDEGMDGLDDADAVSINKLF